MRVTKAGRPVPSSCSSCGRAARNPPRRCPRARPGNSTSNTWPRSRRATAPRARGPQRLRHLDIAQPAGHILEREIQRERTREREPAHPKLSNWRSFRSARSAFEQAMIAVSPGRNNQPRPRHIRLIAHPIDDISPPVSKLSAALALLSDGRDIERLDTLKLFLVKRQRVPNVHFRLHIHPILGRRAEEPREAKTHLRTQAPSLSNDIVYRLPRNSKALRQTCHGKAKLGI